MSKRCLWTTTGWLTLGVAHTTSTPCKLCGEESRQHSSSGWHVYRVVLGVQTIKPLRDTLFCNPFPCETSRQSRNCPNKITKTSSCPLPQSRICPGERVELCFHDEPVKIPQAALLSNANANIWTSGQRSISIHQCHASINRMFNAERLSCCLRENGRIFAASYLTQNMQDAYWTELGVEQQCVWLSMRPPSASEEENLVPAVVRPCHEAADQHQSLLPPLLYVSYLMV